MYSGRQRWIFLAMAGLCGRRSHQFQSREAPHHKFLACSCRRVASRTCRQHFAPVLGCHSEFPEGRNWPLHIVHPLEYPHVLARWSHQIRLPEKYRPQCIYFLGVPNQVIRLPYPGNDCGNKAVVPLRWHFLTVTFCSLLCLCLGIIVGPEVTIDRVWCNLNFLELFYKTKISIWLPYTHLTFMEHHVVNMTLMSSLDVGLKLRKKLNFE